MLRVVCVCDVRVQDCATKSNAKWATVNTCASGAEGKNLMTASIKNTDAHGIE